LNSTTEQYPEFKPYEGTLSTASTIHRHAWQSYKQANGTAHIEALRYRESAAKNRAAEKDHTEQSTIASLKAEQCEAHERTKHLNDAKRHAHLASEHGINRDWDVKQSRFFREKSEELRDLARHHRRIYKKYAKASRSSDWDSDSDLISESDSEPDSDNDLPPPSKKRKIHSLATTANKEEQKRMLSHSVHDARRHHGVQFRLKTTMIDRAYDFHHHHPHVERHHHGDFSHWA
jgi:hypothetical protein